MGLSAACRARERRRGDPSLGITEGRPNLLWNERFRSRAIERIPALFGRHLRDDRQIAGAARKQDGVSHSMSSKVLCRCEVRTGQRIDTPGREAGNARGDDLVRRLYDPLVRRLKAELRLDRERVGRSLDLRH